MNTKIIGGVSFTAQRDGAAWVAQVDGGKCLPQHYHSRPVMWDALEDICRRIGAERFRRDTLT